MIEDAPTLNAIAHRVEQAEGSDRVLDAEIDCAIRFKHLRPASPDDFAGEYGYSPGNIKTEHGFLMASRYSSSIDAAMTLVPEGYCVSAMGEIPDDLCWYCCLWQDGEREGEPEVRAKTPALALASAALKAIAAVDGVDR